MVTARCVDGDREFAVFVQELASVHEVRWGVAMANAHEDTTAACVHDMGLPPALV